MGKSVKKLSMRMDWRTVIRYVVLTGLKLILVIGAALAFYLIYLDGMLSERFQNSRYQAPALIYGRSLTLSPQQYLDQQSLIDELKRLRYRQVSSVSDTGQFRVQTGMLEIYRRPFDFADGPAMGRKIRVFFANEQIREVLSWPDGSELGQFRLDPPLVARLSPASQEDRLLVQLELVPNLFIEALLMVEDQEFYHHAGVSPEAIARAALVNLSAGRTVQGGSTLTQQLIKNLYLTREQTLTRKIREALMALVIDYRFSKNEILETYLNEVYFGQDGGSAIHGIGLASQFYFGKQVQELDVAEIATLIAMVKGPSFYNPYRYPERTRERRDMILQLLVSANMINKSEYLLALDAPLTPSDAPQLIAKARPHYADVVQRELDQITLPAHWQQEGLRVFTYLDPIAQDAAEQAVQKRLPELSKDLELQAAMVVLDHRNGAIKALVGGRNTSLAGGFNRALLAQRQVGSLIKPIIYALALEQPQRYQLASLVEDAPLTYEARGDRDWEPRNYDGEFKGKVMLYDAFVQSRNIPAVRVGLELGIENVVAHMQELGVVTPIPSYPSLTLGAVPLSPMAVARIYATFANEGEYIAQQAIDSITNHNGELLYRRPAIKRQRVFSDEASYLVNYALQGVVKEGTGRQLQQRFSSSFLAGKSGTTNELRDSWFVAFDDTQVATVWVGRDDNQPVGLTGSSGALPILSDYFAQVPLTPLQPKRPDRITQQAFHPETGEPIPLACNNGRRFPAFPNSFPEDIDCTGEPREKSWFERIFGG